MSIRTGIPDPDSRLEDIRRTLRERGLFDPGARSVDGLEFEYDVALADAPPLGGYVELTTEDGRTYVGQVLRSSSLQRAGPEIELSPDRDGTAGGEDVGSPPRVVYHPPMRYVQGAGRILGRLNGGLHECDVGDRFSYAAVAPAGQEALTELLAATQGSGAQLEIGRHLLEGVSTPVRLRAAGFNRHTFLCGQSGSGKTYTLGVVLERLLLETRLQCFVLDPNSDFVHLGTLRSRDALGLDPSTYEVLDRRYAAEGEHVVVFRSGRAEAPLKALFSNLSAAGQALMLGLDVDRDPDAYQAARRLMRTLEGQDYSITDLCRVAADTLDDDARRFAVRVRARGIESWSIWAEPGDALPTEQLNADTRAAVFDLGSLSDDQERSAFAAVALTWLWSRRHERVPRLVVIDEAHNVCPQDPVDEYQSVAVEQTIRLAAEGRKFGLFLLLSTQQPDKIHERILSQCENLLLMRMNSTLDIERLAAAFSFVPEPLLRRSATFRLGQGLAAGRVVPNPAFFESGLRYSEEGGSDLPTDWARRHT